jgi:hypothetical protein
MDRLESWTASPLPAGLIGPVTLVSTSEQR